MSACHAAVASAGGPPARSLGRAARALACWIDRLNGACGRLASFATLAMILLGAFNAVARYTDRWTGLGLSSNAFIEGQWYLFTLVFLLAAASTLRDNRHVRVDLFYSRFGRRGRAWIDLGGTVLFLLPFTVFALWVSFPSIAASWRVREGSPDPDGLARYPIKSVILVAFALLLLQGVAELIKLIGVLRAGGAGGRDRRAGDGAAAAAGPPRYEGRGG